MRQRSARTGSALQRGAAILTAMLTVVLVASLAASVLWQQWRAVEVEAAERARTHRRPGCSPARSTGRA